MFESNDWMFEDAFDDIREKEVHTHIQYQNEGKTSTKRRKIDDCKDSFLIENSTSDLKLNTTQESKNIKSLSSIKNNMSRENLLLGIFQKNTFKEIANSTEEINKDSPCILKQTKSSRSSEKNTTSTNLSSHKGSKNKEHTEIEDTSFSTQAEHCKKVKFVRIFPGPAGLIAPTKNDNIFITSYVNSLTKLEDKRTTECIETNFSRSSQDEKNLFDGKAWKLLVDDLPSNFLSEYRISNIKNRANGSHCDSMKVKFIAGILDYIDYSHDDPFIVLKDSTGSIEGTVHCDIPLNYPGVLEPNVAILLYDVGLLKTTTNVMRNKYHILISRLNLLAVYSDKGRVIRTSRMEEVLSSTSNIEITGGYCITPVSSSQAFNEFNRPRSTDNECDTVQWTNSSVSALTDRSKPALIISSEPLYQSDRNRDSHKSIFDKKGGNCEVTMSDVDDDMNDIFFTVESDLIARSSRTVAQTCEVQPCKPPAQNVTCRENTGERSVVNLESKIKNENLSASPREHDTGYKNKAVHSKSKNCATAPACKKSSSCNNDVKHKTSLHTSLHTSDVKYNMKNSKNLISYFADGAVDNEFDSGDEILSQLDVDNIF